MRPGRIVMLVLGTLSALFGLGLLAGAGAAGWANYQQRDNRYFTTPSARFAAESYALTSPRLGVTTEDGFSDMAPVNLPGSIVVRGSAADPAKQIFIGIAPQAAVASYLADVKHSEVTNVRFSPFRAQYLAVPGSRIPPQPAAQGFWTAAATGPGAQELKWDLRAGNWAVLIMNADASAPVAVDLQAGARSDLLWPIFVGLLIGGLLLLAVGVPLIVAGAAGLGRRLPGQPVAGPPGAWQPFMGQPYPAQPYPVQPYSGGAPPGTGAVVYPARLSGYLDPNLSRWLWLVKWFLAIPHFIILFFLWFALIVVTVAAWFAILFTGRYPRSLFNFNVGVIRWSWRVSFYAYGGLGTDRYPPFTLARTDYPADFDVDYPDRLSRGLVLVKSWLLAIPHLLIVAVLTGTARMWTVRDGAWVQESAGISLLGLLVFIAAVILLFTGQYWRGLFDLVLGLNRWIYRVITYVALMRDEYPPFNLDMGPTDPGEARRDPNSVPPTVPSSALRTNDQDPKDQDLQARDRQQQHLEGQSSADRPVTRGPGEPDGSSHPGPTAPPRP
ncbi:MAG: hypothetical protein JWN19_2560 [Arthrobacter sp.]|nr:hypothetical protein [Arthrobacter sp.]